ncbi:hypothetical protein KGQ71_01190 [Patescibacteria group bacterium]|nr:hypothetical protein [Patescibacteria group bacterium]
MQENQPPTPTPETKPPEAFELFGDQQIPQATRERSDYLNDRQAERRNQWQYPNRLARAWASIFSNRFTTGIQIAQEEAIQINELIGAYQSQIISQNPETPRSKALSQAYEQALGTFFFTQEKTEGTIKLEEQLLHCLDQLSQHIQSNRFQQAMDDFVTIILFIGTNDAAMENCTSREAYLLRRTVLDVGDCIQARLLLLVQEQNFNDLWNMFIFLAPVIIFARKMRDQFDEASLHVHNSISEANLLSAIAYFKQKLLMVLRHKISSFPERMAAIDATGIMTVEGFANQPEVKELLEHIIIKLNAMGKKLLEKQGAPSFKEEGEAWLSLLGELLACEILPIPLPCPPNAPLSDTAEKIRELLLK